MSGSPGRPQRILYVAQSDPWLRWSSSGFLPALCGRLKRRGNLYGAMAYWAKRGCKFRGPGKFSELKQRLVWKLGYRPTIPDRCSEKEGYLGAVLREMPPGSPVIYQYIIPEIDTALKLRRFFFQDLTVFDAVRTGSYGHAQLTAEQIQEKSEQHARGFESAEGILTFSTYAADSITRDFQYPRERITAIGCGPVRSLAESPLTLDRYKAARILFVGRRWEQKGGPTALKAFRQVRRVIPHATLSIVGPEVAPPQEEGVHFHGRVSDAMVRELFGASSLFTMPAVCEAWGIVYVEAANAGLPIAGFTSWALPDIVEDGRTGRLTSDQTPEGLAAAMIELLRSPENMLEMARVARKRVRDILDWRHVVDRLLFGVIPESLDGQRPPALTARVGG